MDKSKICVTRASALRKTVPICNKKQNLLIYERGRDCEPPEPKRNVYKAYPVTTCRAKKIRICTGADLRKMCTPRLCDCPQVCPRTFAGMICHVFGLGFKAAIAAALVYWSVEMGIWGNQDDSEQIYKNMCNAVLTIPIKTKAELEDEAEEARKKRMLVPDLCKVQESMYCVKLPSTNECCPRSPSIELGTSKVYDYWNKTVITAFTIVAYPLQSACDFVCWSKCRYDALINPENPRCKNAADKGADSCGNVTKALKDNIQM